MNKGYESNQHEALTVINVIDTYVMLQRIKKDNTTENKALDIEIRRAETILKLFGVDVDALKM